MSIHVVKEKGPPKRSLFDAGNGLSFVIHVLGAGCGIGVVVELRLDLDLRSAAGGV